MSKGSRQPVPSPPDNPSKALLSVFDEIFRIQHPFVLDAGCGFGRNAVALAKQGAHVVCLDRDQLRLRTLMKIAPSLLANRSRPESESGFLYPVCADIGRWPFAKNLFSAIICVHVAAQELLDLFRDALVKDGVLYIETFGNQGRNYLDLPKAGQLQDALASHFRTLIYRERKAGPIGHDAVCATYLGQKF